MKKTLSLLLVLVMCLSLCACGSNAEPTEAPTEPETTTLPPTEPTEPEVTTLYLNQTVTIGDYELTVTDVRFVDKFVIYFSTGSRQYGMPGGAPNWVVVSYSLKNVGKTDITAVDHVFSLEYSDGYTFESELYVHSPHNPDIYTYGGTQESYVTLDVLGREKYFLEAFNVPAAVAENPNEPLKLHLNAGLFGQDNLDIVYNIRPIDEAQAEALYQQALALMDEGKYYLAMSKLTEIIDYKDAAEVYETCKRHHIVGGSIDSEEEAYLLEHMDEFETVTGEELSSMMVGTWKTSMSNTPWVFKEDGTIDDGWGNARWWSVSGDKLILKTDRVTETLTVVRICEDGYVFFDETGKPDGSMYLCN